MKPVSIKPAALALALGMALAGLAVAQSKPTPAQQKELDAARTEVERAAERLAELSVKYGEAGAPIRIERRMLRKPVIGVVLVPDDASGVRIAGVTPGSAAAGAGLKSGDRIISINGSAISAGDGAARVDQTRELLAGVDAKTSVKLRFDRAGTVQTVDVMPQVSDRLMLIPGMDDDTEDDLDMQIYDLRDGETQVIKNVRREAVAAGSAARIASVQMRKSAGDARQRAEWAGAIAPGVRREVILVGDDCKGEHCKLPMLAEAFRWNGLNLAAVDASLGRYFGTTDGVLVLSTGKDLEGLQAGDVIRRIDGKAVNSPREAMDMLRAQPAAAKVSVDYLRDRKQATAQVTVPKALPFRMPPAPPMPPMPPMAPAAPGAPQMVQKRKLVLVDNNGKVQQWEGDADDTPPAWAGNLASEAGNGKQVRKVVIIDKDGKRNEWEDDGTAPLPPPPPGARVEKRTEVIIDENGKRTVINGNDLPPPPPPAPMAPPPPPAPPSGN